MSNNISLKKSITNKRQFSRIINPEFTTFTTLIPEDEITVDEFFQLYDRLFFNIPINGETNSHEFLVRKSSELGDFNKNTEDIEPLLQEITSLRERLLQANRTIVDLEIKADLNSIK